MHFLYSKVAKVRICKITWGSVVVITVKMLINNSEMLAMMMY